MKKRERNDVFRLVLTALMIAISVVLNRVVPTATDYHITLDFVPIFIVGMMFGPLWCGVAAGVADTIGAILLPFGAYNPLITLSMVVRGLIFGFLFHRRKVGGMKLVGLSFLAAALDFVRNMTITTYALWLFYAKGRGFFVYMGVRLVPALVWAVVIFVLLPIVYKAVSVIISRQKVYSVKQ